jgi:hypothetical protein
MMAVYITAPIILLIVDSFTKFIELLISFQKGGKNG